MSLVTKFGLRSMAVLACGLLFAAQVWAQATYPFDLPEQSLAESLRAVGHQTSTNVMFEPRLVKNLKAPALRAHATTSEAIRILLSGTQLNAVQTAPDSILIQAMGVTDSGAADSSTRFIRLAQVQADGPQSVRTESAAANDKPSEGEVVVTGTNIRGVKNSAAPVIEFDREDIQRTGIGTLEQVLETLPQNVGGQRTSFSNSSAGGDGLNFSAGTGVDLRGLGDDSTLILMNGRRLAPSGLGNYTDTSVIPLDAVDRIEVLTDGASAIYGSDAVAGVINIILRKDYEGVGMRLRYGTVTDGNYSEPQATLVAGTQWDSGSVMLSYNYLDRPELNSEDRRFTRTVLDPTWLSGQHKRHSGLATLSQRVGERTTMFADAIYSTNKDNSVVTTSPTRIVGQDFDTQQLGGTLGAHIDLWGGWAGEVSSALSENRTQFANFLNGIISAPLETVAKVWSTDLKADGAIGRLPGGAVRAASGGQFRQESYQSSGERLPSKGKLSRDVYALFGEVWVPLIGAENALPGVRSLDLTLAARYEHYTDFGNSTNPKVGLAWTPVAGLKVRGTYGTSFAAPLFNELNTGSLFNGTAAISIAVPDPRAAVGTTSPVIYISSTGGNPNLGPETSTNWTVGLDLRPESAPHWALGLTYFNIEHTDRIAPPVVGGIFDALANEGLNATSITRNPTAAQVNALWPYVSTVNGPGIGPTDIRAIIDNRPVNIAGRREDGVDVDLSYRHALSVGEIAAKLSGTYLFKIKDQVTPASPELDVLNTVYRPVDLRLRGGLEWSHNAIGVSTYLNYVDSYRDTRPTSLAQIDSFTTVDLTLSYRFDGQRSPLAQGLGLSLSVQNLFDEAPPYVFNTSGYFFDSTNASPLGRFVALELRKQW